jgi:RNA 3'-terminal phosphate cyclase-like protein
VDKISNGSRIEVNATGTALTYQPGLLQGGRIEHGCSNERSIGYYLEVLVCLAPFCKKNVEATLHGVTNNHTDPSADTFRLSTVSVLKQFLAIEENIEVKVLKRGLPPDGGGEVYFTCPIVKGLKPIQLLTPGKIKKVRGVAFTCRVSPAIASRIVEGVKSVLLQYLPDVYIFTDHFKKDRAGNSPGFGVCLVAESNTGSCLCAEKISNTAGSEEGPAVPEDLGKEAAYLLLEEIHRGGCVDSSNQSIACLLMALGQNDVSKVKIGPLSPYTIQFLRHLRDFFQVMFRLEVEEASTGDEKISAADKVLLTCLGVGYTNINRTAI